MVWIVVCLLEHHGVSITSKHLITLGLPCAAELVSKVDAGLTTMTTTCLNLNDTIRAISTPLGSTCSILQDGDTLDILRIDLEQCRELFLIIHRCEVVSVLLVFGDLEDVVIEDNQRLRITIDGGRTTQTHGRTRTEVTRIWHDVKTGNLTLQSLVNRLEGKTLHVLHLEVLDCTGIFAGRDLKTSRGRVLLTSNGHLSHSLGIVLQGNLEHTLACSYLLTELFIADIGNFQHVVRILDIHGKVTIHISNGLADNTIVLIFLHDVGTDDNVNVIRNGT